MKDISDILIDFNRAIAGSYERNMQCLEDIEFANVPGSQWKGADLDQFKNKPKPENNKIARQVNRVLGQYQRLELNAKIIGSSDDATDEDADLLQSRWRNDFQSSDGVEAVNNAAFEAFYGGFGAIKLQAEYEDDESPDDDYQSICVKSVWSAASSVVYNAGAIRKDKADAKQCWQLIRANRQEIEDEYGVLVSSFNPSTAWFDWCGDSTKDIYVAHYYEVVEKKIKTYDFGDMVITKEGRKLRDEFGERVEQEDFDILMSINDPEIKTKKVKEVWHALLSGDKVLEKPHKTPFKRVPIIPQYGYHCVINGTEYYCGEVARQRDNQRFHNMMYGALMSIVAQPQSDQDIYAPEQVQRFAEMHSKNAIEVFPYLLADPILDANKNPVHFGPVGKKTPPQIGTGLATALQFVEGATAEQGGMGQSTLPSNTSGEAILQVNERQDDSYQPMFQNGCQTLRAACDAWIPAAQKIYFSSARRLRVMAMDGRYSTEETLQYTMGDDGEYGPFKNTGRGKYDVVVKAGESYKTKKQEEKAQALEVLKFADTSTPMGQMALLSAVMSIQGEGSQQMRRLARAEQIKLMLSNGMDPEPANDDEKELVAKLQQQMQQQQMMAQQQQEQMMQQTVMAEGQARLMEGQAALMNEQNDAVSNQIKLRKVIDDEAKTQIEAAKAGVEIQGKKIDNIQKVTKNLPQQNQNLLPFAQIS